jgi:hypothetical protein
MQKMMYEQPTAHRLTQHLPAAWLWQAGKKFVPYGTHPNFCFAKTSFMLEPLGETAAWRITYD